MEEIEKSDAEYQKWKAELIEVTKQELIASGYRTTTFKINDAEARKCFNSGMSPLQTFREEYEQ